MPDQSPRERKRQEVLAADKKTPEQIQDMIRYHETGADWFQQHGDDKMAAWNRGEVERWRARLEQWRTYLKAISVTGEGWTQ